MRVYYAWIKRYNLLSAFLNLTQIICYCGKHQRTVNSGPDKKSPGGDALKSGSKFFDVFLFIVTHRVVIM